MKGAVYIFAGIGLITLGALGTVFIQHANVPYVVPVEAYRPQLAIAVDDVQDTISSAPARVAAPRNEAFRMEGSMPPEHAAWYPDTGAVHGHTSWMDIAGKSVWLLLFMGMLVFAALIALKWKLDAQRKSTPAESEGIQSLHRQAQSLAGRMEALETILLERGQHGR